MSQANHGKSLVINKDEFSRTTTRISTMTPNHDFGTDGVRRHEVTVTLPGHSSRRSIIA